MRVEDPEQLPVKKKRSPKKREEEAVEESEPMDHEPVEEEDAWAEEEEEPAEDGAEEAEEDEEKEEEVPEPPQRRKKMVGVVEEKPLLRLRTKTSSDSLGECMTPAKRKVTFSPEEKSGTESDASLLGSSVSTLVFCFEAPPQCLDV